MKNLKALVVSILIPLAVGGLAGFLTRNNMDVYNGLIQPPLSPPSWIFPIAWTILYILMGISAYLIYQSDSPNKESALRIYAVQLIVNFLWSIIFFNMQMYLFAFLWLLLLLALIILMIISFSRINKTAAYLLVPYLLWVIFAGYLNFMIYLLNR